MKRISLISYCLLFVFIATSNAQVMLQRCDRTNLWTSSNTLTVDVNDKKEGIASIQFTGDGINWFTKTFSQVYTGVDESGYLSLWLYISDEDNLNGEGYIEISSSGGPDIDEYAWDLVSLNLTGGWNKLILPIASALKTGNPNLDAINFFRVYQNLIDPLTAKIDDIRFLETDSPSESLDPLDIPPIDFSTLDGKVMFGYQGWFLHPNDGSMYARWRHWGGDMSSPEDLTVDMFPDFREYEADELFPTGNNYFTYDDGRPVNVYSAYTKKTVVRHMKWLRDYGLDGVFLQRFITNTTTDLLRRARDTVTANIMYGCEKYGRAFVNMWDLSSFTPGRADYIISDWKHLVDDLKITESPSYLHHRGRPLLAIWGFSVREEFPESDLQELLDFFKSETTPEKYRASVMLGVDHDFHERPNWLDEMAQADVISPWAVGRFGDDNGQENFMNNHVLPGQDWCDQNNVDFLPVIWPGFSWANLKDDTPNKRPRRGGNFFWTQATRVISGNAKSIYIAMFDEVDEATAMFKLAENDKQTPDQGYWLPLDADGYDLPSDWYLRCAKKATNIIRGTTDNQTSLGTPPDGIDDFSAKAISARCGEENGKLRLNYPLTEASKLFEFSINGGTSYPYVTPEGTNEITVQGLSTGVYNIWVRNEDNSYPTDLGEYTIFDTEPSAKVFSRGITCSQDGFIQFLINDLPYAGEVQISLDSGQNYNFTSEPGVWRDTIFDLEVGSYSVWIRDEDESCARELETLTISNSIKAIEAIPMIDGVQLQDIAEDTVHACPGSSLILFCWPMDSEYKWTITGPNDFYSNLRNVQISSSLTTEMFGKYEINYTSSAGCDISTSFVLELDEDCELSSNDQRNFQNSAIIYPNPVTEGKLYVEISDPGIRRFEIYNVLGSMVHEENVTARRKYELDTSSGMKHGIYFLKLIKDHDTTVEQFIVE